MHKCHNDKYIILYVMFTLLFKYNILDYFSKLTSIRAVLLNYQKRCIFTKINNYWIVKNMIHLIVGNTGSGKTTYSKRLKEEINGIVFSIDQWNNTLFIPDKKSEDGLDWFLERIDRVELIISSLILQLENIKTDSILDLGLSKFEHREKFRAFAESHKIEIKIHFLNISREIRKQRVIERNKKRGETFEFEVTEDNFEFMENWFEKPTEIELTNGIVINEGNNN